MNNTVRATNRWTRSAIAAFIIFPLIVGVLLSLLIPRPVIGVIHLNDAIYYQTAREVIAQVQYAYQNPRVRAVVLIVDSPGGTVSDTESVYLELSRLRTKKPLVTVVEGMAASGAYYLAVGTDYIFTKPSSEVGNIGVIGIMPQAPLVIDEIYSTGPYKLWSSTQEKAIREIEMAKEGFFQAVLAGRGDVLKADRNTILSGMIWSGLEAQRLGVVDEIGTQSRAIEKAASLAHIVHYEIKDLRKLAGLPEVTYSTFFFLAPDGRRTAYPTEHGYFFLYIPPSEVVS